MSVPKSPAFRVQWRAKPYGAVAHAVISDVHPLVLAAVLTDPGGGPYEEADFWSMLTTHGTAADLPTPAPRRRRCAHCTERVVGFLASYVGPAAFQWAVDDQRPSLEILAAHSPIGDPVVGRG